MSANDPAPASRNVPTSDPAPVPAKPTKAHRIHGHPILRIKRRLARI